MWVGFSSSPTFQLGLPCFCLLNILGSSEGLWERVPLEATCLWYMPLFTKKQANTSFSWPRNCFCWMFTSPVSLLRARSDSAQAGHKRPVPADGCGSWTTTENRVNSLSLAILSIPVPFESPWIALRAMRVWSVPRGSLRQVFYPLRFLMPSEPKASLN